MTSPRQSHSSAYSRGRGNSTPREWTALSGLKSEGASETLSLSPRNRRVRHTRPANVELPRSESATELLHRSVQLVLDLHLHGLRQAKLHDGAGTLAYTHQWLCSHVRLHQTSPNRQGGGFGQRALGGRCPRKAAPPPNSAPSNPESAPRCFSPCSLRMSIKSSLSSTLIPARSFPCICVSSFV